MPSDQVVREQLLALLIGGNAHMTFEQAVANFPAEHYNTNPPNITYTPWHILEHLRIAQWDILEFIRNPAHVSPEWPKGYWPDPNERTDQEGWGNTINAFLADLGSLRDIVKDPDTDLYAPIPHARDYTIFREILVVSDHNAYHIGEFGILRQVMGTW
ncbi:MAG: DinB family protein [Chloroflexota bacterium]|nr:MAG: DinB family protein [Chloroflexota bacterium]